LTTIYKKIFHILLFVIGLINVNGQTIPRDKQLHLLAGASFGAWCYTVGYCYYPEKKWVPIVADIGGSTMMGIGKETWDKLNGRPFDVKDLGATITGAIISVGLIEGIRGLVKRHNRRYHPEHLQIFK
jgi:hypothetical protein